MITLYYYRGDRVWKKKLYVQSFEPDNETLIKGWFFDNSDELRLGFLVTDFS